MFDHACICLANQEAKSNEKSYTHLFKMKNFLRQVRAMFGLMHLWSIDGCLEMIEYCLTKSRLFEYPNFSSGGVNPNNNTNTTNQQQPGASSSSTATGPPGFKKQISIINMQTTATTTSATTTATTSSSSTIENPSSLSQAASASNSAVDLSRLSTDYVEQIANLHRNLTIILTNKKNELTAYKELTKCARLTLEKYYQHQQIQDAAGFYDKNENQGKKLLNI